MSDSTPPNINEDDFPQPDSEAPEPDDGPPTDAFTDAVKADSAEHGESEEAETSDPSV